MQTRTIGPLEYKPGVLKGILGLSHAEESPSGIRGWRGTHGVIRQCKGYGNHRCSRMLPGDHDAERCARCDENLGREIGRRISQEELYICPGPEMYPDMETCGKTLRTRDRCEECQVRREWLRKDAAAQKRREAKSQREDAEPAKTLNEADEVDHIDHISDADW